MRSDEKNTIKSRSQNIIWNVFAVPTCWSDTSIGGKLYSQKYFKTYFSNSFRGFRRARSICVNRPVAQCAVFYRNGSEVCCNSRVGRWSTAKRCWNTAARSCRRLAGVRGVWVLSGCVLSGRMLICGLMAASSACFYPGAKCYLIKDSYGNVADFVDITHSSCTTSNGLKQGSATFSTCSASLTFSR